MSLRDAVLAIADEMEQEANQSVSGRSLYEALQNCAKQLRIAVKAAEESAQAITLASTAGIPPEYVSQLQLMAGARSLQVLKAKEEARVKEEQQRAAVQEKHGAQMMRCVGGKLDETYVEVDGNCIEGAMPTFGDEVYMCCKGELHYSPEQTAAYRKHIGLMG